MSYDLNRRKFFAVSGAATLSMATASNARVPAGFTDYTYEINKTDEEWLAQLGDNDFAIMREGYTEKPKSSPYWEETAEGSYHCKACELKSYDARWKTVLDKGWVFFFHSEPASVLMNIDGKVPEYGSMSDGQNALTEVHCRRCASHLGHYLIVEGKMLHCINGASLTFTAAST